LGINKTMTSRVVDFRPTLRAAIAEARAAGLADSASQLEEQAFAAYATSSEWLGEAGLAIKAFLASAGSALPQSVAEKLNVCLVEVHKVWPRL
jgi:hypothetical protein